MRRLRAEVGFNEDGTQGPVFQRLGKEPNALEALGVAALGRTSLREHSQPFAKTRHDILLCCGAAFVVMKKETETAARAAVYGLEDTLQDNAGGRINDFKDMSLDGQQGVIGKSLEGPKNSGGALENRKLLANRGT